MMLRMRSAVAPYGRSTFIAGTPSVSGIFARGCCDSSTIFVPTFATRKIGSASYRARKTRPSLSSPVRA